MSTCPLPGRRSKRSSSTSPMRSPTTPPISTTPSPPACSRRRDSRRRYPNTAGFMRPSKPSSPAPPRAGAIPRRPAAVDRRADLRTHRGHLEWAEESSGAESPEDVRCLPTGWPLLRRRPRNQPRPEALPARRWSTTPPRLAKRPAAIGHRSESCSVFSRPARTAARAVSRAVRRRAPPTASSATTSPA